MKTSKKALLNKGNIKIRLSNKKKCFNGLVGSRLTIRELSKKIGLPYNATQKRVSDLFNENKIIQIDEKLEGKNYNSVYKINNEPCLFDQKLITLRQFLKGEYPEILDEYNRIFKKNEDI